MLHDGLTVGDRVGIWAPNCVEWALVQYATAKIGVILVNINPAYRTHEVEYVLHQSGCRWLVAAPSFKTSDYVAMIAEVRDNPSGLERVLFLDTDEWRDWVSSEASQRPKRCGRVPQCSPPPTRSTSSTRAVRPGARRARHSRTATSSTTRYSMAGILGYTDADRVCIPVPLYHCFGMGVGNLGCVTTGATMVYPAATFEPVATMQAVQDERCTSLYGVPTMWIAQLGASPIRRVRPHVVAHGIMGGSPCPIEVMKRAVSDMHTSEVCIVYGMTETAPISFITRRDDDLERAGVDASAGCTRTSRAKIVDPATGDVGATRRRQVRCAPGATR